MSMQALQLSDSALFADLGPGERSLWRFAVAVVAGFVVFSIVTVVTLIAVVALYIAAVGWPAPTSVEGVNGLLRRFVQLGASDGRSFADALQILGLGLSTNVAPMFAFIGLAALAHARSIRNLATTAPRFRWRMLLAGLVLSALILGPFFLINQMLDPKAGPPPILTVSDQGSLRAIYAAVCMIGFVPAALGEEILFRGWLLRQTSNLTRNAAVLMILNGVIFAAAHADFAPDAFLERAIMGAGLTYMTLRLGGVELSAGVHAANNLTVVIFIAPLTLKLTPNTGLDVGTVATYVGLFLAYVAMAEITARWTPLRRWTGADQTLGPPPATAAAAHAP
jgi:hypothetical protein